MASFFAPTQENVFDFLINEYNSGCEELNELYDHLDTSQLIQFITSENVDIRRHIVSRETMITNYRGYMWDRAFKLTDVMDYMPAILRDAWSKLIQSGDGSDLTPRLQLDSGFIDDINTPIVFNGVPEFTFESIRTTLGTMLRMREHFLTMMVDSIFFNLSGEHVTNRPEGFSKRFIINNVFTIDYFGMSFDRYSKVKYIQDLRFVIAKMLGRTPERYASFSCGLTDKVLMDVVKLVGYGQWMWIDGNSMRVRCYKKGTVHIELHPEITWQLNNILANKYPSAIPPKFRKPSKPNPKEHQLIKKVLNEALVRRLSNFKCIPFNESFKVVFTAHETDKLINSEINAIMSLIGGVNENYGYLFDYDPSEVILNMVLTGVIPDKKSHQFYPSPESVVDIITEYLHVSGVESDACICEPSCGTGNIINGLINAGYTNIKGFEISPVFASVASSRLTGVDVQVTDFLSVTGKKYDVIVMNPPFNEGRWGAHLAHALTLSDQVIAVLPSVTNYDKFGRGYEVIGTIVNGFNGTSIDVNIVSFFK